MPTSVPPIMNVPAKLGAVCSVEGVNYRVWAPKAANVYVAISPGDNLRGRSIIMQRTSDGYHEAIDVRGRPGDRYQYRIEGQGAFPDPVSRAQEEDVHGNSIVVDAGSFKWSDREFRRPLFRDLVIYEIHVGGFTPEGSFISAIERLDYLEELGVTAIEIMPIADFPGERNWGYDGVLIYAPAWCYGTPDDLRTFVDAAHSRGMAVILDVVYNHFGPDGNCLPRFSDTYFSNKHETPWGAALNFDGEGSGPVREFFIENSRYWMDEFHIDGFRLDAAHEIIDDSKRHVLADITEAIHSKGGYVVAEDDRNDYRAITPVADGGLGLNGVWADDFHHTTRVSLTGEQAAYFVNFGGSMPEIAETLRQGWFYSGQTMKDPPQPRGTRGDFLPPERFVHCISNHDQVGNRALGERIHQLTSQEAYRALSALLCLSPYTPMLFMGQEWAASTPFLYFTDHHGELGKKITEGRRREFASFSEYDDASEQATIPDPQDLGTFHKSRLEWNEIELPEHAAVLALYEECLNLRSEYSELRPTSRDSWRVEELKWGAIAIYYTGDVRDLLLVFDLTGGHSGELAPVPGSRMWRQLFSTDEAVFGGTGHAILAGNRLEFDGPALVLLERAVDWE